MTKFGKIILISCGILLTTSVNAGIIAEYDFTTSTAADTSIDASSVASGYTASPLTLHGVTPSVVSTNHFYASGWDSGSFNANKYYSLTINATTESILDRLVFSMETTGNFALSDSLRIASSLDGFSTSLIQGGFTSLGSTTAPATDAGPVYDFDFDLTSLMLEFTALELRFYVASPYTSGFANHDCEPSGNGCGFPDIGTDLFVSASTVPTPATLSLMGLGLLGFGVSRRKIKK